MRHLLPLILLSLIVVQAFAQKQYEYPRRTHFATRLQGIEPKIDGKITDDAWRTVAWSDSFLQLNPIEGDPPSEETRFKVLYGEKNIYFAFICYDSEPDKIATQLTRRDDVDDSDFIAVGLDSYYDRRTAFTFGLNAGGVKLDLIFSNDGDNSDESWDPVWEGKTALTDSGWTAEMRIPYSQIRFADKEEQVWGFQILRKIYRKQEEVYWQLISKDAPGLVSYFGILRGINGIKMPPRVELSTYGVQSLTTYKKEAFNPFGSGRRAKFNGGLDGKIGVTSNLTMDFTINPDFGQVEADPSEVNLSAYESFFEERRPFFIEGRNIFSFPLAMGDGDFASEQLFYSRRIGRRPHYYPDEEDGFNYDYADQPAQTRILGAAKLSGKTEKGWSVGILDAVTNIETAELDNGGERQDVTVEPLTNYFVSRLQKDFDEGNTSFGGILTATNRRIEDAHLDFMNRSAYTGGIDIRHQWDNKAWFVSLKLAGSYITGKREAIIQAQRSSARYYQRPDITHVQLDSSRTSLSGYGGSFNIGRGGNSNLRYATGGLWRSPGFEINDLGFMRQADRIMHYVWVGYNENDPTGIFRNYRININEWQGFNFNGDVLFMGGNINGGATFMNYWGFHSGFNRQGGGRSANLLRGGPMARTMGGWNNWVFIRSDSRKDLQADVSGNWYRSDDGISGRKNINFELEYKMNDQVNLSVEPFYSYRIENLQYIDELDYEGDVRYMFGRLKQNTAGMVFRLNYSPRPNLSIQYFGQPFTSAGVYSRFKQVDRPKAYNKNRYTNYTDAQLRYDADDEVYYVDENLDGGSDYSFDQPNFNVQEFLSNLVVRWEYKPGSLLYLVWSQNRNAYTNARDFKLSEDMQDLFETRPTNVFLIKMNYWFSL